MSGSIRILRLLYVGMERNSRLIELRERRLTAEEKRREEEEAAKKAAATTYVGPIGDPFGAAGASSSSVPSFVVGGGFSEDASDPSVRFHMAS